LCHCSQDLAGECLSRSQSLVPSQAKALLESIVGEVLLGQRFHGLLFHHRLLDDLLHHFLSHDFSVTCIRRGLQVCQQLGSPLQNDESVRAVGVGSNYPDCICLARGND